ncbi:MAG: hypothetical protein CR982_06785 [Candidatus Cloacimonadota bacterium]|nr:MAG: hypothetical protein CR982_06785 [Candidatus Cloacimonadota bacterium]PIE77811.1 MAG: hypothetical protein CSA15_10980 [Candidatus Delongbacteria bacterium]
MLKSLMFVFVISFLFSCENRSIPTKNVDDLKYENKVNSNLKRHIGEKLLERESEENKLRIFAKALARSLNDQQVAKFLHKKFKERFDGQHEILWQNIKEEKSLDLRGIISKNIPSPNRNKLEIMDSIEEFKLLNISMPVKFSEWDGVSPVLVTYTPRTVDDTQWDTVVAFDSDLNEYSIDAKTAPDFPVIVIGQNERVDKHTLKVKEAYLPKKVNDLEILKKENKGSGGSGSSYGHWETIPDPAIYFEWVQLTDLMEPWLNGDPEVLVMVLTDEDRDIDYMFGDDYGYWNLLGYNYSHPDNWKNHLKQFLFRRIDGGVKDYMGIKIYELDDNDEDNDVTITISHTLLEDSQVDLNATWKLDVDDDYIGSNQAVLLGTNPRYTNRNEEPESSEMNPCGSARFTIWWTDKIWIPPYSGGGNSD